MAPATTSIEVSNIVLSSAMVFASSNPSNNVMDVPKDAPSDQVKLKLVNFSNHTCMHGIDNIARRKGILLKIFWVFVMLCGSGTFI